MHLIFGLFFLVQTALAQDDLQRASDLYKNGQLLFEEGNYAGALIAWKEAYELTDNAAMLKHIARAQEAQGDYNSAIETVSNYRALAPYEEQQALKEWSASLLDRQREAERLARERAEETRRAEERRQREEEQQKLEEERRKLDEGFKQLNDEQQLASFQQAQRKQMIPMLVSWTALTALSTTTIVFHRRASNSYETIERNCNSFQQGLYCRYPIKEDSAVSLNESLDKYNSQRIASLTGWGLSTVVLGFSAWSSARYLKEQSNRPTSQEIE